MAEPGNTNQGPNYASVDVNRIKDKIAQAGEIVAQYLANQQLKMRGYQGQLTKKEEEIKVLKEQLEAQKRNSQDAQEKLKKSFDNNLKMEKQEYTNQLAEKEKQYTQKLAENDTKYATLEKEYTTFKQAAAAQNASLAGLEKIVDQFTSKVKLAAASGNEEPKPQP